MTSLVCQVTGGPCTYIGRDMETAHAHLSITETEWQALVAIFHEPFDHFEVPAQEQAELFEIIEGSKADIVAMP